ncbi:hypothetical protein [Filimonas effusa]|uniref:Uncharacterized protein n=1 Tax=Filimonas effusa TaxID=2508721 RepID=A0A4V1M9K1_9BACT|nr:hypothetical protein [Filimonas effusa]RXK81428.1 hypothetical protein ESB13_21075 [Filimonas effusa]
MLEFYVFIFVCVLLMLASFIHNLVKRKRISAGHFVHPLVSYGRKMEVDFDKCELKTNTYYEEVENESFPTTIQMIDALYRSNQSINSVKREVSVLLYKHQNEDGSIITYRTPPITMQPDLIRYNMLQQKKAVIYVDPVNDANYFFDTGFTQ